MGTFLDCVGKPHIPDDRQEEFQQRMLCLFREGGMMCDESVEMFGKRITLLHTQRCARMAVSGLTIIIMRMTAGKTLE